MSLSAIEAYNHDNNIKIICKLKRGKKGGHAIPPS